MARAAVDLVLLAPGLSVIIDAIRTSREIFQRMTSYAIDRIAETIRILLSVTIAIVVVNFFPVTPITIVLLALLNDGAILTIAYDRVLAPREPAVWQMRTVLSIATVLGVVGVIASFTLFILADTVFHVDHATLQAMIYLKLSVAGHLTIFLTRTRGPFWSHRPAPILIAAVGITQLLAVSIAVYGVFMTPIGWTRAAIIWGYAIVWFLVNDRAQALRLPAPPTRTSGHPRSLNDIEAETPNSYRLCRGADPSDVVPWTSRVDLAGGLASTPGIDQVKGPAPSPQRPVFPRLPFAHSSSPRTLRPQQGPSPDLGGNPQAEASRDEPADTAASSMVADRRGPTTQCRADPQDIRRAGFAQHNRKLGCVEELQCEAREHGVT